jgi:REP element-mobilizing transposase RayT
MPNHIHGIIMLTEPCDAVGATRWVARTENVQARPHGPKPNSIGAIIAEFKSVVTKRINEFRNTPRAPVWQRNYYDHIIRNEDGLDKIREYIVNHPAQWSFDWENPALDRKQFKAKSEMGVILNNQSRE